MRGRTALAIVTDEDPPVQVEESKSEDIYLTFISKSTSTTISAGRSSKRRLFILFSSLSLQTAAVCRHRAWIEPAAPGCSLTRGQSRDPDFPLCIPYYLTGSTAKPPRQNTPRPKETRQQRNRTAHNPSDKCSTGSH